MSIASEITNLQTNLQAAKSAVTAKGGTIGDTGLAGLASEIESIPNGGGQSEPSSGGHITGYDTATGVITGDGFGTTAGTVYLLNRDTNTYVSLPTSSWKKDSITLATPVDLTSIEGTTSLSVVDSNGMWATKWLITGTIPVQGWGKLYIQNMNTGVVSTITMTSRYSFTDATNQQADSFGYQNTVEGITFYRDEIVGLQYGEDYNLSSAVSGILNSCTNMNQPVVVPTGAKIAQRFLASCTNFNQPVVLPSDLTSLDAYFMQNCYSFNQPITLPEGLTATPYYFMDGCRSFNQPLTVPNTVTSIGTNFLSACTAFNQPLTLPTSVTTLGSYFLSNDASFNQPLVIPSGITTINTFFMSGCSSFNQPIALPSGVTGIGNNFLSGCSNFNQPLAIPSTVTTIGNYFVNNAQTFNQPITLSTNITSIGSYFLSQAWCFNQPLTLPSSLLTIGQYFMEGCKAFSQPLVVPNGVTGIGSNFMQGCISFGKKLTLPSTVTSVGTSFLGQGYTFTTLETNTTASPTDNYSLATYNNGNKTYLEGVTITGTGASAWVAALPNRTSSPYRKLIDGGA